MQTDFCFVSRLKGKDQSGFAHFGVLRRLIPRNPVENRGSAAMDAWKNARSKLRYGMLGVMGPVCESSSKQETNVQLLQYSRRDIVLQVSVGYGMFGFLGPLCESSSRQRTNV